MKKQEFSVRLSRKQTVNGQMLASMNQTDALKHFGKLKTKDGKRKITDEQIKKAHTEAVAQAKILDAK